MRAGRRHDRLLSAVFKQRTDDAELEMQRKVLEPPYPMPVERRANPWEDLPDARYEAPCLPP